MTLQAVIHALSVASAVLTVVFAVGSVLLLMLGDVTTGSDERRPGPADPGNVIRFPNRSQSVDETHRAA